MSIAAAAATGGAESSWQLKCAPGNACSGDECCAAALLAATGPQLKVLDVQLLSPAPQLMAAVAKLTSLQTLTLALKDYSAITADFGNLQVRTLLPRICIFLARNQMLLRCISKLLGTLRCGYHPQATLSLDYRRCHP